MIRITKPYKEDMIIPISVTVYEDNDAVIDVYKEFYDLACEYESAFKDDLFSEAALSFLDSNIDIEGYCRYDDPLEYYHVFEILDITMLKDSKNTKVVDLYSAEYDIDETGFEVDVIKENGEPASLIVEDGRIAAVAAANFFIEADDPEVELAVETLPMYREKGYGKAVLCDMVKKVLAMGKYATYRVSCNNTASIATVRSCGFMNVGKEFYFNCYKEEE